MKIIESIFVSYDFYSLQLQQVAGYRSPRPSPQSSPSLGGRHSAPCSPGAPSPLPNEYVFNSHQTAQLQQHFEQFSMVSISDLTMFFLALKTEIINKCILLYCAYRVW